MSETTEAANFKGVGRNDPCPCGSNKKFKRCHGEAAAQWVGNTITPAPSSADGQNDSDGNTESESNQAPQFDPSKMDLAWLAEFSGAIQKLPKGQLARLQGLMQKAMAGKNVTRELNEFQRTLPVSVQELLKKSPEIEAQLDSAKLEAGGAPAAELTSDQKEKLAQIQKSNARSGLSNLWNRFRKK